MRAAEPWPSFVKKEISISSKKKKDPRKKVSQLSDQVLAIHLPFCHLIQVLLQSIYVLFLGKKISALAYYLGRLLLLCVHVRGTRNAFIKIAIFLCLGGEGKTTSETLF